MTPFFKKHWAFLKPLWEDHDGLGLLKAACGNRREDATTYLATADRAGEIGLEKAELALRDAARFVCCKGLTISQLPEHLQRVVRTVLRQDLSYLDWYRRVKIVLCDVVKVWNGDRYWHLALDDCYIRDVSRPVKKIVGLSVWSTAFASLNRRTEERKIHVHPMRIVWELYREKP